jgi:hypothetical protein
MPLFAKRREMAVQRFLLKFVNNNCSELEALIEGPRLERRVNLTTVVMVIPFERKKPQVGRVFFAITKELATSGVAVVVEQPMEVEEVVLGFRWESGMIFVRGKKKHLNPMGGGFYQLGLHVVEVLQPADYPELASLTF